MSTTMQRVYVTTDDDGHWYVLPHELRDEFWSDLQDEEFIDSGGFGDKYGQYMTGGDLNLVALFAEL